MDQIQLIRGLVHVVGLSIRQVRQILALVRDPELSPAALMTGATVTLPLTGPRAADVDETDLEGARAALAAVGFDDLPDAPYATQLLAAIALADECGIGLDAEPAKAAFNEGISLKEACLKLGFLSPEKFDEVFKPEEMV